MSRSRIRESLIQPIECFILLAEPRPPHLLDRLRRVFCFFAPGCFLFGQRHLLCGLQEQKRGMWRLRPRLPAERVCAHFELLVRALAHCTALSPLSPHSLLSRHCTQPLALDYTPHL